MQDIYDVRKTQGIYLGRKDPDDETSVQMVIDEDNECEFQNLFGYSPALDKKTGAGFRLGLQTRGQLELLRKYGSKGVAVDATFKLTQYQFVLITLLVLDERQTGRPVASFICHGETIDDISAFFEGVKFRLSCFSM